ncbi:uncharacterized protein FOBCDRAFT_203746 [Fusarium oxysporum Fo47]|uniref:uncharacterized protein n=1 Tax=Fusarium oxysporum Fo47 TaxID=660027 RepID=UPI0028698C3B|nr:uncharacterized protein FOBCDRAFT_203746 [Fusarium oxysporum Fo47]WJG35620.1 hypothetical protein FOBCDRAFT_203746 [Fusarium oxysporum Fo47]
MAPSSLAIPISANQKTQKYAQKDGDHNLELLLEEVPLPPNEVLRIPALFKNFTYPWPSNLDGLPPRLHRAAPGRSQVIAFLLVAINGVVIGSDGLTAKPWGPIVDDHDTLEQAMRDVYGQAGIKVRTTGLTAWRVGVSAFQEPDFLLVMPFWAPAFLAALVI